MKTTKKTRVYRTEEEKLTLAEEYRKLPKAEKVPWCESKGIHIRTMAKWARGECLGMPGIPAVLKLKDDPRPVVRLNKRSPSRDEEPTLDEIITAFRVKRDVLNEFIAELERMKKNG